MTLEELVEECVEHGMDLELAERIAPLLLPLLEDRRGFAAALSEAAPTVALSVAATLLEAVTSDAPLMVRH